MTTKKKLKQLANHKFTMWFKEQFSSPRNFSSDFIYSDPFVHIYQKWKRGSDTYEIIKER